MKLSKLFKDNKGVAIIEMALILPLLLVIVFATIEFGNYFVRWAIVQRAATSASSYIQNEFPNSSQSDADRINPGVMGIVGQMGYGIVQGLNVCGVTGGATIASCPASSVFVARFNAGVAPTTPYNVRLLVSTPYATLTGISSLAGFQFPTVINATSFFTVTPGTPDVPRDSSGNPTSCTTNQFITYNATNNSYVCTSVTPYPPNSNCATNQFLTYNQASNSYVCSNVTPTPPSASCTTNEAVSYDAASNSYYCKKTSSGDGGSYMVINHWTNEPACNGDFGYTSWTNNPKTGGPSCPPGFTDNTQALSGCSWLHTCVAQ